MSGNEWTLRANCEGGLLYVEAAGVATVRSLQTLRRFVAAELQHGDARAVVIDLRSATTEMGPAEWAQNAKEARSGAPIPVAMVVQQKYWDAVIQHCYSTAEAGLDRMAFTDFGRAKAWVLAQLGPAPVVPISHQSAAPTASPLRLVSSRP